MCFYSTLSPAACASWRCFHVCCLNISFQISAFVSIQVLFCFFVPSRRHGWTPPREFLQEFKIWLWQHRPGALQRSVRLRRLVSRNTPPQIKDEINPVVFPFQQTETFHLSGCFTGITWTWSQKRWSSRTSEFRSGRVRSNIGSGHVR